MAANSNFKRVLNNIYKKGFTLIELLAVIVILAIIALIATPIILNMINDARKSAAVDSAYGYIEAIDYNNSMSKLNSTKYPAITATDVATINGLVNLKGKKPTSGTVTITNGKITEANLCINNYSIHYNGTLATIEGNACNGTSQATEEETPPTYTVYADGTAVYYNPVTGTKCNASEAVSTTGTKEGCMKFYTFNDEGKNASTVNMILDHNTTASAVWNSSGKSADGMNEIKTVLETDTTNWKDKATARLITVDEVAHIVGADKADTIKWNSSKTYGTDDIETKVSWFYFDGTGTTYSETDGWQKQVATSQGASKYAWLFDNTKGCTSYGCNKADSSKLGYWTSTYIVGISNSAWVVYRYGMLNDHNVDNGSLYGVRPVITIPKSIIEEEKPEEETPPTYTVYADGTAVYYNPVDGEKCNASEAVSTTGTKEGCMKFYTFNDEGKNASTVNMILDHNTTEAVAWNSSGNNADKMNEVKTALETDTTNWKDKATARLITAAEVAHIVGADRADTIKWNSSKTYEYGTDDIETKVSSFYFDGTGTTYSKTDGWLKQVATSQGASKYAWLFDNTKGCTSYGCNIAATSKLGYWTSTPVAGDSISAWGVYRYGMLNDLNVDSSLYGFRPVITIPKSIIS